MTVIATDASVRQDGATWAAVLRGPSGQVLRLRGRLGACDDPNHAELLAVHRALRATRRDEPVEILVDNNRVVAWLTRCPPPARFEKLVATIRAMLAARSGRVVWTPAHCRGEDGLHREADVLASAPGRTITYQDNQRREADALARRAG